MIWYILGFLLLVAGIAWGYGRSLPARHRVVQSIRIGVPAERVWEVVTDMPGQVAWRHNLESVRPAMSESNEDVWEETMHRRTVAFRTVEAMPPRVFVRETVQPAGAFVGRWTLELTPREEDECRATLAEEGEIAQPLSRLFAKWFGADLFIKQYLMELALHLGESVPRWEESPAIDPRQ